MIKTPKVSMIIPIYNVDRYLEEALDSILGQSIGFKENVEIILVNDGSPDKSEEICIKYRDMYPENIIYIYQNNAGVSAARNKGLMHARGKYVHFMDPDDTISKNTLKSAVGLLDKNKNISVASVPIYFFGAMKGAHPNNNKFDAGTRVVDMSSKDTTFIQSNVATVVLRRSSIKDLQFDTKLKFGEDGKFINEILYANPKIGLVTDAAYNYRKRGDGTSAVDGMVNNKSWYFDLIERYLIFIAKKAKKRYKHIPRYVQNIILHDLRWRFEQRELRPGILNNEEVRRYKDLVKKALQYVDDITILESTFIRKDLRIYMLKFKNGFNTPIRVKGVSTADLMDGNSIHVDSIDRVEDNIVINGRYTNILSDELKLIITCNNKPMTIDVEESIGSHFTSMGDEYKKTIYFKTSIPINSIKEAQIINARFDLDNKAYNAEVQFEYNSRLSNINKAYTSIGDILLSVSYVDGLPRILIERRSLIRVIEKEINFSLRILVRRDILSFGARIIGYMVRLIYSAILGRKIWLLIDRPLTPTDNASSMFRYLNKIKDKRIAPFMIVSKESHMYEDMRKIGKVVPYEGLMFRMLAYSSSAILSSHFDGFAHNPFGFERGVHMRVGLKTKFIYLQHGVLASDLSKLISKTKINSNLITVSSKKEKRSILQNREYGYDESNISISGQARFDDLLDVGSTDKRIIAFAPTWRFNLFLGPKDVDGKVIPGRNKYNSKFTDSDYFKHYNTLINDPRILDAMARNSFTGIFCIHPQIAVQSGDFKGNERIIVESDFNYTDVLKESSILVTDYSGIAFDFAYMKKPLIYSQFDKDEFYKSHTYDRGYFSFEDDGFGPVVDSYELTVKEIVKMINAAPNIKMNKTYEKRVDDFFENVDNLNCKRIYESILELS